MNLAKLREMIAVVGMTAKSQEILLNPHSVVKLPTQAGRWQLDHTFNRKRDRSGGKPAASGQHPVNRAEGLMGITQDSCLTDVPPLIHGSVRGPHGLFIARYRVRMTPAHRFGPPKSAIVPGKSAG